MSFQVSQSTMSRISAVSAYRRGGALEELEGLRQQHLGREHAAVAGQPGLATLPRDVDDASGLRGRSVVLPQLEVCLRFAREFLAFAHGTPASSVRTTVALVQSRPMPTTAEGSTPESARAPRTASVIETR